MLSMAVFAIGPYCFGQSSMKAFLITHIIKYVLMIMALHAQLSLLCLVWCVVALVAVFFVFLVSLDDRAGHQKRFQ